MRDWTTLVKLRLAKIFFFEKQTEGMTKYYLLVDWKTASLPMIAYRG